MFNTFDHYLSYGSTDQQTLAALSSNVNGLIVPGTIAAFQAEGTKGFVLSLAESAGLPYAIDSRFPLFQSAAESPKKSHVMLADLLGVPALLRSEHDALTREFFTDEVVVTLARHWIDFCVGFPTVQSKTFAKYAARLGQPVLKPSGRQPLYVLPPYLMVEGVGDPMWDVSNRLWEESERLVAERTDVPGMRRVVAALSSDGLRECMLSISQSEIVAWVSGLEEFDVSAEGELAAYVSAVRAGADSGKSIFALYGGFFSVLLARVGLTGSSHGIGFGEHRVFSELPRSGGAPARYYVPRLHRYISVDAATTLWRLAPELVACECEECNGRSPGTLEYHALMRHSVRCRAAEIARYVPMETAAVRADLEQTFQEFRLVVPALAAPRAVKERVLELTVHLPMWSRLLAEV